MITSTLAEYNATSLVLELDDDDATALDQYLELAGAIGAIARGHQWWVGDLIVEGEKRFGEVHAQAEQLLGLEPKTLQNYAWVAAHVEPSRRRDELSWSHHAEVARLAKMTQRTVLGRAVKEGWTVRQLRDHVALTFPLSNEEPLFPREPDGPLAGYAEGPVNKRLEEIQLGLEKALQDREHWHKHVEVDDVVWLHQTLKHVVRGGG